MAEVQDILREYGETYLASHKVSNEQKKVITALSECRTASMGAHKIICDECGHTEISYNSCRNRHCPKCQTFSKEKWIDKQKLCLLPVGYFHIVFTIPDTLNSVAFQNQRTVYNLMFRAAWETLRDLSSDRKYLGAEIGVTSVLHTWGQQLVYHPHIHCIVSGGGITKDGKWKHSRKVMTLTAEEFIRRFLLHVLPKGFNKIRHFGYLGSRYRAVKLGLCRKSLKVKTVCRLKTTEEILQGMGIRPYCSCPRCGSEKLHHSYTVRMNN